MCCCTEGCLDIDAVNYYAEANTDNGSCCYVSGCMDSTAFNYNPNACLDDGSLFHLSMAVLIQPHLTIVQMLIQMMVHVLLFQ